MDENEKKDLVRNIIIAGTSVIPMAGGVLSFFLDKYLPSALENRKEEFLKKIESDLNNLPDNVICKIYDNPDFTTVLVRVLHSVLAEHREEKINIFRNFLINAATNDTITFNEEEFFLKLLDILTLDQIRLLKLFYLRDYKKSIDFSDIYHFIREHYEVDKSYLLSLSTELIRYQLIAASEELQRKKGNGQQLSSIGEKFINFIFYPIED